MASEVYGYYNDSNTLEFDGVAIPSGSSIGVPEVDGDSSQIGASLDVGSGEQPYSPWDEDYPSGQSVLPQSLANYGDSDADIINKARAAADGSGSGEKSATDYLAELAKKLGGNDKAVAALIQGGFGMLGGYSQGKMLEEKMKNDKKARDEEWARKDARSAPGKVAPMKFGLLGQK